MQQYAIGATQQIIPRAGGIAAPPVRAAFANHRVRGFLIGEGTPAMDYIEILDIPDLDGFTPRDMPGAIVQGIMGEFMSQVDNARFIVADEVV